MVSRQDDVREEWSQIALSGPTMQVLRTRQSPDGCEGGCYYYLVDMEEKTVQPLMNALCIADNISWNTTRKRTRAPGSVSLNIPMTAN